MPGLIDSHVHVVLSEVVIRNLENVPLTLMTARAAALMRGMLDRGFTSVRDTGGADWGLKEATDKVAVAGAAAVHRRHARSARPAAIATAAAAPILACAANAATPDVLAWASPTASPKSAARCARRCARAATR